MHYNSTYRLVLKKYYNKNKYLFIIYYNKNHNQIYVLETVSSKTSDGGKLILTYSGHINISYQVSYSIRLKKKPNESGDVTPPIRFVVLGGPHSLLSFLGQMK